MKIYKIKIRPKSSQITPWQSDTIFGSLCWALAQKEGANSLQDFLNEYENGHFPLVISNGFPGDLLPKPMAGNMFKNNDNLEKNKALEVAKKAKNVKKTNFVSLDEFNTIINNGQVEIESKEKMSMEIGVMHNQLSRITGTTGDGNLYEQPETFWNTHVSVYFSASENWQEKILALFELLSIKGFGKRASVGKGHFSIENISEFKGFAIPKEANSFVSLANYIPKNNDPVFGQYKTFVKHGKLGQDYALAGNPFKRPLLMIMPGAVFWTDEPKLAYGRLVKKVSPQFVNVVQYGCTLAIPAYVDKPDLR